MAEVADESPRPQNGVCHEGEQDLAVGDSIEVPQAIGCLGAWCFEAEHSPIRGMGMQYRQSRVARLSLHRQLQCTGFGCESTPRALARVAQTTVPRLMKAVFKATLLGVTSALSIHFKSGWKSLCIHKVSGCCICGFLFQDLQRKH